MKFSPKTIARYKRHYAGYFCSLPCDKAMIRKFVESHFPSAKGKLPTNWPAQWIRAEMALQSYFDLEDRACALRVIDKDVKGFALSYALHERGQLSANREHANLRFRVAWRILRSAAVHDWKFVEQLVEKSRNLISGSTCYHLLAKALACLVDGDSKKAASIAKQKDSGSASYYLESQSIAFTRALCTAIAGAVENDPKQVAKGLKLAFVNAKKRGLFEIEIQGLAALIRKIDPSLLSEFDANKQEFWDAELWDWTENNSIDFSTVDLRQLSHEMHEILVDLKEPKWLEFERIPGKNIKISQVAPPEGISQQYWQALFKRYPSVICDYVNEFASREHFIDYRKLSRKSQPAAAFDWNPRPALKWIQDDFAQAQATNIDEATWYQSPEKDPKKFWAIKQHDKLVAIFVDPANDKEMYELRKFETEAKAKSFLKESIQQKKAKGFVLRKEGNAAPLPASIKLARPLADPNQQAVAEFWQGLGVSKLQAQKMAKKAAREMDDDDESFETEMRERAKEKREAVKAHKAEQNRIKRETAAINRKFKSSKSNASSAKTGKAKPSAQPTDKEKTSVASSASLRDVNKPRRFEFTSGSSNKFWNIQLDGSEVITLWGRIGTSGQTTTKSFSDAHKARIEYDKLVREKIGKGYIEV